MRVEVFSKGCFLNRSSEYSDSTVLAEVIDEVQKPKNQIWLYGVQNDVYSKKNF